MFIVIEGIDGTGKSTQAARLSAHLTQCGHDVVLSREPTDGPWGKMLRSSAATGRLTPEKELEAFINDRKEHVEKLIKPALAEGKTVILDRYYFSTMAYQSLRGFDPIKVRQMNEAFAPVPDLLLIFDLEIEAALKRIHVRDGEGNFFEKKETLEACRSIFLSLQDESIAHLVDASGSSEQVAKQIKAIISATL